MKRELGMMTALLALAACEDTRGLTPQQIVSPAPAAAVAMQPPAGPRHIMAAGPSEEIPLTPCGGNQIGDDIIMTLDAKMMKQLGAADQEIARDVSRGGQQKARPPLPGSPLYPTNLDIGVNGALTAKGDFVKIVIKLQSANAAKGDFIFLRPDARPVPGNGDNASAAVTVRNGDAGKFCGRSTIARDKAGVETVSFGSLLEKYQESSINIGVLISNKKSPGLWTPVYIDPNMRNVG